MNDSSDEIFENTAKSERTVDVDSKENQGSKAENGETITAEFDRFFFDNLSDGKLRKLQDKIDDFLKIAKSDNSHELRSKAKQELTQMVNFMKAPRLMLSVPQHQEIRAFRYVQAISSLFLALSDGHLYCVDFKQCLEAFKKDQCTPGDSNRASDQNIKFNEKLKMRKISGHSSWKGELNVNSIHLFKDTSGDRNLILVSDNRIVGCKLPQMQNFMSVENDSEDENSEQQNDSGIEFKELFSLSEHSLLSSDYSITQTDMKHGNLYLKLDHADPEISLNQKVSPRKPVSVVIGLTFENSVDPSTSVALIESQMLETKSLKIEFIRACPIFTEAVTSFFIDNFEPFEFLFISTHKVYRGELVKEDLNDLTLEEAKPSQFSEKNSGHGEMVHYQLEHKTKEKISEIHFSDDMGQMFLADRPNRVCCLNAEKKVKQMAYNLGKADVTGFLVDSKNQKVFTRDSRLALKVFDLKNGQLLNQCKEPLIGLTDSPLSFSSQKDMLFMSGLNHIMFFRLRSEDIISDLDCDDLKGSRISISQDLRFIYLLSESGKNIKKLSLNDLEEVWSKNLPKFRKARFKRRGKMVCILDGERGRMLENVDDPEKNQLIKDGEQLISEGSLDFDKQDFQVIGVGGNDKEEAPLDESKAETVDLSNDEFNKIKEKTKSKKSKLNPQAKKPEVEGSGLYLIDVEKLEANVDLRDDAGVLELFKSTDKIFAYDWSPSAMYDEEMLVMLKSGSVYSVNYSTSKPMVVGEKENGNNWVTKIRNNISFLKDVKAVEQKPEEMSDVLNGRLINLYQVFDPFKKETPVVRNNKIVRNFTKEFKESNIDNIKSEWVSEDSNALNTLKKMVTLTSRKSRFHNESKLKPECLFSSRYVRNLNLVCMSETPNDTTGNGYFKIFGHYEGLLCKAKIRMESMDMEDMGEEFKVLEIYNKKRYKSKKFHFLVYSESKIILLCFLAKKKRLEVCKIMNKQGNEGVDIKYIPEHKLFLVPYENSIEIWDRSFTHRIYTIKLEVNVCGIRYSELHQMVMIFDKSFYYEFDLVKLEMRKKLECQKRNQLSKVRKIYVNYDHCLELRDFQIPDINYLNQLEVLAPGLRLDFCEFPFESLMNSFNFDNYQNPILDFSKFYFSKLTLGKDSLFESLNPFHFAIFHGDSKLLEKLLEKYGYPREFECAMTPLEYANLRSSLSSIETICGYLVRSDKTSKINFTNLEFNILLSSELKTAHDVLSEVLVAREERNFPNMAEMNSELRVDAKSSVLSFLLKLQKGARKSKEEDGSVETVEHGKKSSKKKIKKKEQIKTEIDVLTVPFVYDYSLGSENSVDFLKYYSTSESDKFVTSEWKHLINQKWKVTKMVQMFICLLYFGFIVFATIVLVFEEGHIEHTRILIVLVCVFIGYEVFQVLAYLIYDIVHYLKDLWNYIDWIFFIVTFIYPMSLQGATHREGPLNRLLGVVILVLMYYRGFSFLRIFDYFTSLVGMINTIFVKIIPFMIVLFYMYTMVVLMFLKLTNAKHLISYMTKTYYYMLFGGITNTDFAVLYSAIPIIFGTVIITIILLNILIAYLSNVFSRLEEQETINTLREKAQMILDFELIIRFFRKVFCIGAKKQNRRRLKKVLSDQKLGDRITSMVPFLGKTKNKNGKKTRQKFKMLFLVKKTTREVQRTDDMFEEQMLTSVENLTDRLDDLMTGMTMMTGVQSRTRRGSVTNKFNFSDVPNTKSVRQGMKPIQMKNLNKKRIRPL